MLSIITAVNTSCTASTIYTNPTLGISVEYPSDWQVYKPDLHSVSFISPGDSSSYVTFELINDTTIRDPIIILEKISAAGVNAGTLETIALPESTQIRNYQAAIMRAVMEISYNFYIDEEGVPKLLADDDSITPLLTHNVPVEIIAIVDEHKMVVVFVQLPNRDSQMIVESLSFTN